MRNISRQMFGPLLNIICTWNVSKSVICKSLTFSLFFICSSTFPRDRKGKIIEAAEFQKRATSGEVARVAPNRKWFGRYLDIISCHLQESLDSLLLTFVQIPKNCQNF